MEKQTQEWLFIEQTIQEHEIYCKELKRKLYEE